MTWILCDKGNIQTNLGLKQILIRDKYMLRFWHLNVKDDISLSSYLLSSSFLFSPEQHNSVAIQCTSIWDTEPVTCSRVCDSLTRVTTCYGLVGLAHLLYITEPEPVLCVYKQIVMLHDPEVYAVGYALEVGSWCCYYYQIWTWTYQCTMWLAPQHMMIMYRVRLNKSMHELSCMHTNWFNSLMLTAADMSWYSC